MAISLRDAYKAVDTGSAEDGLKLAF